MVGFWRMGTRNRIQDSGFREMDSVSMNFHKKYTSTAGYTEIIERGEMGLTALEFGIVSLAVGDSFFEDTADTEAALTVLAGQCTLLVGHNGNKAYGIIGERENVFDGVAYRAYIPYRTTYEIIADEAPVEVAVCKTPSFLETAAVILEAGDNLNNSEHGLIVSETPMSTISGEALCLYRFKPADGSVVQRIYTADGAFAQVISLGYDDVFCLPEGYHAELVESSGEVYCLCIERRK
jgi:5-deoxy-D-glucuronate isomerase